MLRGILSSVPALLSISCPQRDCPSFVPNEIVSQAQPALNLCVQWQQLCCPGPSQGGSDQKYPLNVLTCLYTDTALLMR